MEDQTKAQAAHDFEQNVFQPLLEKVLDASSSESEVVNALSLLHGMAADVKEHVGSKPDITDHITIKLLCSVLKHAEAKSPDCRRAAQLGFSLLLSMLEPEIQALLLTQLMELVMEARLGLEKETQILAFLLDAIRRGLAARERIFHRQLPHVYRMLASKNFPDLFDSHQLHTATLLLVREHARLGVDVDLLRKARCALVDRTRKQLAEFIDYAKQRHGKRSDDKEPPEIQHLELLKFSLGECESAIKDTLKKP